MRIMMRVLSRYSPAASIPCLGASLRFLKRRQEDSLLRRLAVRSAAMAGAWTVDAAVVACSESVPPKMKIALCQIQVTADKLRNIETAKTAIREAATQSADLIVLPEIWNSPYSNDSFPVYCEPLPEVGQSASASEQSPSFNAMLEAAKQNEVYLVGGSIPETQNGKLYNTCCVFDRAGRFVAKHRKVHLFDIDIPGKITFKESETLTAGDAPTVFETAFGKCAVGICYDIRFPELAMLYANAGARLIIYPGAFNMTTGPAHWELLQRARATDNQLFVAMCSPARNEDGYQAWGHSTVVGPFGEVLATCEEKPTIVYATLDLSEIETRRANMPLESQKRKDLYELRQKV